MTLQERINELDDETVIYLGAASSFFFIGTKSEFEKDIDEISRTYYKNMVAEKKKIENDRKHFAEVMKQIKKISGKTDSKADMDEVVKLSFILNNISKRLQYGIKRIKTLGFHIDNFIPMRNRQIKREYDRLQGGHVILIDGIEVGRFWFYEEYLKGEAHDDSSECDSAS